MASSMVHLIGLYVVVLELLGGGGRGVASGQTLSPDFYATSCASLQSVVSSTFQSLATSSNVVSPSTLRMLMHDCFIQGCDGSILISSTPGNSAERDYIDNDIPQQAFDTIDSIKQSLENVCPGVVSCADIVVLAAREAISFLGGPTWEVSLGRRDSRTSLASNGNGNIPASNLNGDQLISLFQSKGLDAQDLVALSGSHTIGFSKCRQFTFRLNDGDQFMNPSLAQKIQSQCPTGNSNNVLAFDPNSPFNFDSSYFQNIENMNGLLFTDQVLFSHTATQGFVRQFASSQSDFFQSYINSIIKMASIGVLTGQDGEIRQTCTRVNPS